MRLLLDTHALLWSLGDPDELSEQARKVIVDGRTMVFVSAASAWEIAVKKRLGKLQAPDDLEAQLASHRFEQLDITCRHAIETGALPAHHRDPFDRLLVAQARLEGLTVVTRDPNIPRYGISVLPA